MGIRADSEDDEIPKHQDQVHGQEKPEEEGLLVWIFW